MYSNQSFDEKVTGSKHNDDYDLCNTDTSQQFVIKWSPQDGARYLSKSRYASPRSVSKSVPRRKRGIVRYNINRSLNFDVGSRRSDNFKSPNSSSDSNVSIDGEQYLSRSAKILRALNINYSPLQNIELSSRRINKSLNFDLSPSPKRLTNFGKSPRNNSLKTYPSPLSKINKTLDFDTSSNDSHVNSALNSSVESIDENQNQTPSQRNKSAKKSLNYLTPRSGNGFGSPDTDAHSPMLRSGLKTKIDNIVLNNLTPNMQSTKRTQKTRFDDFEASTPRNLFNDFDNDDVDDDDDDDNNDDDDDDNDDRPQTPENVIRIIPESMSAIKKSHKKERVLGRIGKAVAYLAESRSGSEAFTDKAMHTPREESRPTTPIITIHQYESPQRVLSSIKKSHKKDKSKRKSFAYHSDDNMSDTGSIFDYTEESNAIADTGSPDSASGAPIEGDLEYPEIRESYVNKDQYEGEENSHVDGKASSEADSSLIEEAHETEVDEKSVEPSCSFSRPESPKDADRSLTELGSKEQNVDSPCRQSTDNTASTPPRNPTTGNSLHPVTPENRINFLQRIMTNSIKKSHKKIKDINRKSLFRARTVHDDMEEVEQQDHPESEETVNTEDGDRAGTPENTNSSRLLLSQFSSVKKSHRKDKHRRMLTGSMQRKKFMNGEDDAASNVDDELHNSSLFSSVSDLPNLPPPQISPKRRKDESNDFSSDNSSDANYRAFEKSPLKDAALEMGVGALPSSKFPESSPNKRKNLLDVSSISGVSQSSSNPESMYESAEEEFKIFTPIKKRKSLGIVAPAARRICETNDLSPAKGKSMDEASMENSASRCCTPTTARSKCFMKPIESSFKTPDRSASGVSVTITDYSTPVLREIDNTDDPSGRSTPQNSSTAVLMAGINSIKKSHKKDKRGNISRRSLICAQEEEYESEAMSSLGKNQSKSSSHSQSSPQPSTSYESAVEHSITEPENETLPQTKTPPNCLKVKTYLRLVQSASIKRSHKKERERKKHRSIFVDPELSDDGSIFDEAERSLAMENESLNGLQGNEANSLPTITSKMCVRNSPKGESPYYVQDAAPSHYNGNLSNDGSIFASEERIDLLDESGGNNGDEERPV